MLATKLAVRSEESVGTDKKGPGGALGRIFSLAHVSRLALKHATVCQHEVKNASHISESLHREDPVSPGTVLRVRSNGRLFRSLRNSTQHCHSGQILGCPVVIPTDGPSSNRQTEKDLNRIIKQARRGSELESPILKGWLTPLRFPSRCQPHSCDLSVIGTPRFAFSSTVRCQSRSLMSSALSPPSLTR